MCLCSNINICQPVEVNQNNCRLFLKEPIKWRRDEDEPQTWDCIFHLYFASLDMIGTILDLHPVVEDIYHKSVPQFPHVLQTWQTWFDLPWHPLVTKTISTMQLLIHSSILITERKKKHELVLTSKKNLNVLN